MRLSGGTGAFLVREFLPGSARGQSAESVGKKSVPLWQSKLYIHCAVQQRQRCGFVTVKIRFQVRADAVL